MPDLKYPYDFVPFGPSSPDTAPPPGHEEYSGQSGVLKCTLTALTPLLVKGSDTGRGDRRQPYYPLENGRYTPIIPGTSLKGMVRSVFEVLVNGCVGLAADGKRLIPSSHSKCKDHDSLCMACRAFGFLSDEGVHRGLVNIGQASLQNDASQRSPALHLPALYGPNVTIEEHGRDVVNERYYGSPEDPNGRKFYLHHRAYDDGFPHATQKRDYVEPLEGGAEFGFEVTFENLSSSILSALVAALTLSDNAKTGSGMAKVRHKLGYGKPAGLGSANIDIERAVLEPSPEARYQEFGATPEEKTGEELSEWIEEKQARFFNTSRPDMQALAQVLRWPPDPEVDVTYDADAPE
ncbi:RAMP superfamily CRISPR-associated protein [Salinibacter ruber]|uniref:RAMP superfamily CRISPR-associated protein n=1 Tax=Salinibacter ruber TaxID=146919 RepID=UPI0021674A05|nr:RAMP superfamily CRISPR-associated protein [Salinibacter ruber]